MAKKPDHKQAQAALDKHLASVNAITDAEKLMLKPIQDLAKAMGESYKDTKALLSVREKTRSLEQEIKALLESEALSQDESVKIAEKALKMKQKEIARQNELNATFDKFKEGWEDFWAIAQDPKVATGLFLTAAVAKAGEMAGTLMDAQTAMGLSYTQGIKMAGTLTSAAGSGLLLGIGLKQSAEAAGALAEELGDISEVSSKAILTVAKLGKKYGIASSEAAGLYKQIKLMSGGTDDMVAAQIKHAENLARANNVAPGKVVADMAKNSEFMAKFMGKNSKSMAETAVQAAKLGVEMSAIASMMDSILDIETSIEKEMQVSVLLGRQISFDKARQLAMAGKTVEATKAILQQVGGIAEFEKMSVIQRKALADAAGVDLATMQSIVGNREKQIEMGLVEASTQEEIFGYVHGIFTTGKNNIGVLTTGLNMVTSLAQIKSMEWSKGLIARASEAAHSIWMMAKGTAMYIADRTHFLWKWAQQIAMWAKKKTAFIWEAAAAAKERIKDKAHAMFMKGKAVKGAAKSAATKMTKGPKTLASSDKMSKSKGGVGKSMKDLAGGLRSMGKGTFKGILAMALAGPALILAIPAIPFLLFMGLTPLKMLGSNMQGLATGLRSMGKGTFKGLGALLLFAVAGSVALLTIPFLLAISILGAPAGAGLTALGTGLSTFGATAPATIIGIGLIALLGIAMIPFAFALSLVTPLIEAFGNIIIGVMGAIPPIIEAVAAAMITLAPALPQLALGFLMLVPVLPFMPFLAMGLIAMGAGMAVSALGFGLFKAAGGPTTISLLAVSLTALVPLASGIMTLGPAFASMAGGIALLAGSLLLLTPMLPTLLLLGGLALGVGAIMGGTIGGKDGKDGSSEDGARSTNNVEDSSSEGMTIIAEKLDTLIELMSRGGDIKMDGKKVGEVIALARGPMGT